MIPSIDDVFAAAKRIDGAVHRTPILTSSTLNDRFGREVFFKCENFQKIGAFKARGALNAVLNLDAVSIDLVTHSSGNHGAALAWAARRTNRAAYIICPSNASRFKRDAIVRYGGTLVDCGPDIVQRETALQGFLQQRKAAFIPPYDHEDIIAGQGTATLELLEDKPQITELWVPIGGGGLASGAIIAAAERCRVIGCEPELARDAHDSLERGARLPALPPSSIADGLLSSLGDLTFDILHRAKTTVHLVEEDEMRTAMALIWQTLKIVIEPSSAVPVAAALKYGSSNSEPIGILLSGGNYMPTGYE